MAGENGPPKASADAGGEIAFEREIEGQRFRFVASSDKRSPLLQIYPRLPQWEPLIAVFETFWPKYGDVDFIKLILERRGFGAEGVVAFAYHEEGNDEVTPGCVQCYFFDDELEVSERFFEAFALAYGWAYLEAARRLRVKLPAEASIKEGLEALAERFRRNFGVPPPYG